MKIVFKYRTLFKKAYTCFIYKSGRSWQISTSCFYFVECVLDESNRQSWWPSDCIQPRRTNNTKRKILYKKFWTMLCHRGVFNDPTYLDRKAFAIARDRQRNFMWHNRGTQGVLLPNCVIQKVREWCPNPPNIQYMGHLWF